MFVTILDAEVEEDKSELLQKVYRQALEHLDDGIEQTMLLRNVEDPGAWRIVTIWKSRAAVEAMRRSTGTPRGIQMFEAAGAQPMASMFDVVAEGTATG